MTRSVSNIVSQGYRALPFLITAVLMTLGGCDYSTSDLRENMLAEKVEAPVAANGETEGAAVPESEEDGAGPATPPGDEVPGEAGEGIEARDDLREGGDEASPEERLAERFSATADGVVGSVTLTGGDSGAASPEERAADISSGIGRAIADFLARPSARPERVSFSEGNLFIAGESEKNSMCRRGASLGGGSRIFGFRVPSSGERQANEPCFEFGPEGEGIVNQFIDYQHIGSDHYLAYKSFREGGPSRSYIVHKSDSGETDWTREIVLQAVDPQCYRSAEVVALAPAPYSGAYGGVAGVYVIGNISLNNRKSDGSCPAGGASVVRYFISRFDQDGNRRDLFMPASGDFISNVSAAAAAVSRRHILYVTGKTSGPFDVEGIRPPAEDTAGGGGGIFLAAHATTDTVPGPEGSRLMDEGKIFQVRQLATRLDVRPSAMTLCGDVETWNEIWIGGHVDSTGLGFDSPYLIQENVGGRADAFLVKYNDPLVSRIELEWINQFGRGEGTVDAVRGLTCDINESRGREYLLAVGDWEGSGSSAGERGIFVKMVSDMLTRLSSSRSDHQHRVDSDRLYSYDVGGATALAFDVARDDADGAYIVGTRYIADYSWSPYLLKIRVMGDSDSYPGQRVWMKELVP